LDEVEVKASAYTQIQNRTQMSMNEISIKQIKSLPVFLGEQDILKSIQLLPGVQSGSEGSSGFYVRGGGPDQNLILLDGVPVYNASHLFGFFSIFNPDAINNVKLYKGGFPARHGGRLSSVLDIRMKDGNMKEFHGEGSIGLISSKLSLEGPIIKDKTSFIVSARRTYVDLLIKPFIPKDEYVPYYFFYDVNTKINHKFSDNNRLYLSLYTGLDKFGARYKNEYSQNGEKYKDEDDFFLDWGNLIWALRWNYIFNPKLFSNTTLTFSRYKYETVIQTSNQTTANGSTESSRFYYSFLSGIKDWTAKMDFDYMPGPNHYVRFGAGDINHTFTPGANQFSIQDIGFNNDTTFGSRNQYANEMFAYIEDDYKINDRLKVNAGFHVTGFLVNGKKYFSFQPRLSARVLLSERNSFKLSYSRMVQYLHLLTNPTIGLPTDLWVPTTDRIKPEYASQVALGYAHSLPLDLDLSVEAYYKKMTGLIEYIDGTSFFG
ncbi:TonB-dependent receptor plug domain-containing protein, partial [Candidatus Venteria ishoeyi]|uniref:TonB-dependent receptor plug domain-containing protein n=1 Tax=Candidatus Venteria ishoeyi TaxID=1899563 RepID=UPI000A6D7CA8